LKDEASVEYLMESQQARTMGSKKVPRLPAYSTVFQPAWRYNKDGANPQPAAIVVLPLCKSFDLLPRAAHVPGSGKQHLHFRPATQVSSSAREPTLLHHALTKPEKIYRVCHFSG